jgi:hypothetical protein
MNSIYRVSHPSSHFFFLFKKVWYKNSFKLNLHNLEKTSIALQNNIKFKVINELK